MKTYKIISALISGSLTLLATSALASAEDLNSYSTQNFITGKIPVGCQPKGMKSDLEGKYLYVAEMCGKRINGEVKPSVSVIDIEHKKGFNTIITPAGHKKGILANTEVEMTENGEYAMIARAEGDQDSIFPNHGMVTVVDTKNQNTIKYIPVKGAGSKIIARRPIVASDANQSQIVYVANYFSDDISILDVTNLKNDGKMNGTEHLKGVLKLKTAFKNKKTFNPIAPRGVAFTNDGRYAFILATNTGSIIVMDSVHHKQLIELAPIPTSKFGRYVNVRHIVVTKDGKTAYLSHMNGNGISRINLEKLLQISLDAASKGQTTLNASTWDQLFVPFANGKSLLVLENYPKDHPNFANKKWPYAHPNTIALDPVNNKYLYISYRTTSNADYNIIDLRIKGKIDILDTTTGEIVMSLVGGAQPTALEISPDNKTLISAGFKDNTVYFYDLEKILNIYEN